MTTTTAASMREPRILGLFDHHGIVDRAAREAGRPHVPGPYRVDLLDELGFELKTLTPARGRLHRKVRDVVEHRSGVDVDMPLRAVTEAWRADAVFAMFERRAQFVSRLRRRGLRPYADRPFWAVTCWWAEELLHASERTRESIRRDIEGIDGLIVFSENQRSVFASIGVPESKVFPVDFGVDPDFYYPVPETKRRFQVFSAGVDRGRDFESLVAAARLVPEARFDIFTQPGRIAEPLPGNVTLHAPVDIMAHRENLRSADLVVVPTHDLAYPTGQSVLLEASACGACVAVTSTEAMDQYIDDGVTALAMPLHDPSGMAEVIRQAHHDPGLRARIGAAARQTVVDRYSFRRMWAEIGALITGSGASRDS
ncbi:glycosyltransferase family 4 protein [Sinomonas sp. ASV486]|uniref:glycosyltransferase family 4 protein n=1 Tax=Sinomonas sp. ASV486 TaxID=3051170 RepID=UPI0027DC8202|nr:glycosyltransferase family 4 protein [Sinomonas sp. ASV486]MDQ4488827.1 glycosyltransferase family 4 protein [Sinomonas sp. ASV486]